MWIFSVIEKTGMPDVPGGLVNWIVVTLVGVLVWLVKRLVDNNQDILVAMKEENKAVRADHRLDVQSMISEGKENRKTYEDGFEKIVAAIDQLRQNAGG